MRMIKSFGNQMFCAIFFHETKTDAINAFLIAEIIRIGRHSKIKVLPENIHTLRKLCQQHFYVGNMVADIKRKIIAFLDQILSKYEKLFTDIFALTYSPRLKTGDSAVNNHASNESEVLIGLLHWSMP